MTVTNTAYSLHSRLSCLQNILETEKEREGEKGWQERLAPAPRTRLHMFGISEKDKTPGLELLTSEERPLFCGRICSEMPRLYDNATKHNRSVRQVPLSTLPRFSPWPDYSCTEITPPLVLSGFQPASYPLKDGLHDAFVSTSYLPGHGGNNSNVWLRENRANHQ